MLHGDLRHGNILLQDEDEWVVIDPKGVLGESAYEVGAFIRNPVPELFESSEIKIIIETRIQKISEILQISPQRILAWCFVQTVLARVWALEGGCDVFYF